MIRLTLASVVLSLVALHQPEWARGHDFRIDTEFFQAEEKEPCLETLTIFAGGVVYDFRWTEPREITVFDPLHGRFTLLDETRKVKAVVTTQELIDFSLELEKHAAEQKGLFAFCAKPEFETTDATVEENGQNLTELRLTSKLLTYVARGQKPQHPQAARAYRQFTDWCARLNATYPDPGNLPAGGRLALNNELGQRELLPLEITRTIPERKHGKVVRSEHRVNWTLSGEDQKRIQRAGDCMAQFEVVSFNEYRQAPQDAGNKQARR
jgi:hypothetical protein